MSNLILHGHTFSTAQGDITCSISAHSPALILQAITPCAEEGLAT